MRQLELKLQLVFRYLFLNVSKLLIVYFLISRFPVCYFYFKSHEHEHLLQSYTLYFSFAPEYCYFSIYGLFTGFCFY